VDEIAVDQEVEAGVRVKQGPGQSHGLDENWMNINSWRRRVSEALDLRVVVDRRKKRAVDQRKMPFLCRNY
jgi:hypothetical protein